MKVTNLKSGDVFQFDDPDRPFFLQVTEDGDCGVFRGAFAEDKLNAEKLEFRIVATQQSVKRDMERIGNFALHPSLTKPCFYVERCIATHECRRVSIIDSSANEIVSAAEAKELEPLAFWETHHIESRLDGKIWFPS